jgi:type III secretory pathway lipoprotein EscJ
VKTLESKETRASKKATVTHNSVFAAHRLQCRMTIPKIDIRHFVFGAMRDIATQNLLSP